MRRRPGWPELEKATTESKPDQAMLAMLRAEVALAEGDTAAATRAADSAWGSEPSVLARETQVSLAYEAANRRDDAIRLYQDALARRAQRLDSVDAPGFHRVIDDEYHLAVLLDDAGDSARAKPLLESLVRLWKDADAGLPALADARQRLATRHS